MIEYCWFWVESSVRWNEIDSFTLIGLFRTCVALFEFLEIPIWMKFFNNWWMLFCRMLLYETIAGPWRTCLCMAISATSSTVWIFRFLFTMKMSTRKYLISNVEKTNIALWFPIEFRWTRWHCRLRVRAFIPVKVYRFQWLVLPKSKFKDRMKTCF